MTSNKVFCDFCKRPNPTWKYPCGDFTIPEVGWGSCGEWAACEVCADYVEKDKLDDLAFLLSGLVATAGNDPTPEVEYIHSVLYGATKELYSKFEANRKGARVLA